MCCHQTTSYIQLHILIAVASLTSLALHRSTSTNFSLLPSVVVVFSRCVATRNACCIWLYTLIAVILLASSALYWAVQWSWFAWVNALCNLWRKKLREVAASLPGRFLSRRRFTLCITMEVEPRIAKQYKCQHCCSCKNYRGKGMEGGRKVSLHRFLADQNIASL